MRKAIIFQKRKFIVIGIVFEWRIKPVEYLREVEATTIGVIPPQRITEGAECRLWAIQKVKRIA